MHDLLIFGDSWAWGAELDQDLRDQQCFGGQLAVMMPGYRHLNFSETGSSLSHLHLQFEYMLRQLDKSPKGDSIAIFFLTGMERYLTFDDAGEFAHFSPMGAIVRPIQNSLRDRLDYKNDLYYKHLHSPHWDILNLNCTILSLQARCRYYGIDDYYLPGWQRFSPWKEIDADKIYSKGQKTCADILGLATSTTGQINFAGNQYIIPNETHPNALGHKLIAQTLYDIISKKLTST